MAHWGELIINDEFHITGRGLILTVNLEKNDIKDDNENNSPIKVGDTLVYKGCEYSITGIETFRNLLNGKNSFIVGLLVKKNDI